MPPKGKDADLLISFDDDDEWQDMPVVKTDDRHLNLDDEDMKKFHYVAPSKPSGSAQYGNATGNLIDFDDEGVEWRGKIDKGTEETYTRLQLEEDNDNDEVHMRSKYLFNEDKIMTPMSQMQATKELLTESQRIAYVGLCSLAAREMVDELKRMVGREIQPAVQSAENWTLKIMGRLYHHMELETAEQKMIESLAEHGVAASDLAPALMTTHTVKNPDYDPVQARRKKEEEAVDEEGQQVVVDPAPPYTEPSPFGSDDFNAFVDAPNTASSLPAAPHSEEFGDDAHDVLTPRPGDTLFGNTRPILPTADPGLSTLEGTTTAVSPTDENMTLDIRWTVLCDLFLALIADSVYDSRSRVLLERVAVKLGLGWLDVVRFEKRITDALEIEENFEQLENSEVVQTRKKAAVKRRLVLMGLATLGGGLVIGLSAGLLAPVIGAGLGAAFTTIGVGGTAAFLGGTAGAAAITTGGVLTGSGIALKGMARRTTNVKIFNLLPLHNHRRVNCIVTIPGFMSSLQDDVRLPFSVLDPIVGDVFSIFWEPEMMQETGNALRILTTEVLTQVGQTVLQATVMTGLMSALTWPLVLTKLGYLIDNPWSNALDRAVAAGLILADVLRKRALGVRPVTLIGFSLGARVIFYAMVELAKQRAFGIVQDVVLLGATITASTKTWHTVRSVVAGRMVNAYARNDWVLNYLFRASVGGLYTVAGLRPIEDVPGLENVDVTDKIAGHASYRVYMPMILHQIGFPVTADYFDEPEDFEGDQGEELEAAQEKKRRFNFFSRRRKDKQPDSRPGTPGKTPVGNPWSDTKGTQPTAEAVGATAAAVGVINGDDDDLPERLDESVSSKKAAPNTAMLQPPSVTALGSGSPGGSTVSLPAKAGFDFNAIEDIIETEGPADGKDAQAAAAGIVAPIPRLVAESKTLARSESAPPLDDAPSQPAAAYGMQLRREDGMKSTLDILPKFQQSFSLREAETLPVVENGFSSVSMGETLSEPPRPPSTFTSVPTFDYNSTGSSIWSRARLAPPEEPVGLSFGAADGSITFAPPPSASPFAALTSSFETSEPTLSFAPSVSPLEKDPWKVTSEETKSQKFNVSDNPWN
ncbi:DUF726-domain-containing protein [Calocera cornea HHB12733]|uniref:DUF726-domain-containing protein n=1 Tax=Calocera cornea HHB12733 TaxID=1353952 RepID=A0A165E597_9BASI|nr:DUF726-domain-containing protein [Calocera cornea HHB12733]